MPLNLPTKAEIKNQDPMELKGWIKQMRKFLELLSSIVYEGHSRKLSLMTTHDRYWAVNEIATKEKRSQADLMREAQDDLIAKYEKKYNIWEKIK
jgi:hypothetical protein